jgi:hypothetical protein
MFAMTFRTVVQADYEAYLEFEYPATADGAADARAADRRERGVRLAAFPHGVLLQVSYAEMDFGDRWCWQQFGPAHGDCQQAASEYPACHFQTPHSHDGVWMSHWLAKTDYNFGFNEWYFVRETDRDRFLAFVPHLSWGEHYPK